MHMGTRLCAVLALLATLSGAALAGQPTIGATWLEAMPDGQLRFHARLELAGTTQTEMQMVLQFRLADEDSTIVMARGSQKSLLLHTGEWKRGGPGTQPLSWHPAPATLSADFFAQNAQLGPGTHFINAIYDPWDLQARKYTDTGYWGRATLVYTSTAVGPPTLRVPGRSETFPNRNMQLQPPPPVVQRAAPPPAEEPIPRSLSQYGLKPLRVFGSLRLHHGAIGDLFRTDGRPQVCFTPDGRALLTASEDDVVKVWDLTVGVEVLELRGRPVVAADGTVLVLTVRDDAGQASVVEPLTGRRVATLRDFPEAVHAARLSPDGSRLLVLGAKSFFDWALATGALRHRLDLPPVRAENSLPVAGTITADGRFVAMADESPGKSHAAIVYDTVSGRKVAEAEDSVEGPPRVLPCDGGRKLATVRIYEKAAVEMSDPATGRILHRLDGTLEVQGLAVSPDSKLLATAGCERGFMLFDTASGSLVRRVPPSMPVRRVLFTRDGRRALLCGDYALLALDVDSGRTAWERPLSGLTALSPDGRRGASLSAGGKIEVWDVQTGRTLLGFPGAFTRRIAVSSDGHRLAVKTDDGLCRVLETETGRAVLTFATRRLPRALNADGTRLVTTEEYDTVPTIWRVDEGEVDVMVPTAASMSYGAAFSPDGRFAAIRVWQKRTNQRHTIVRDLVSRTEAARLIDWEAGTRAGPHWDLAARAAGITFSPDGARRVDMGNPPKIVDTETGGTLCTLEIDRSLSGSAFSPDGRQLLILLRGKLHVLDAATGKLQNTHGGPLMFQSIAFAGPNRLVTGCNDSAVVVWQWP